MKNIQVDYYFYGVRPEYQTDPHLILGLMGVLNSTSGLRKLFIAEIVAATEDVPMFENCQTFKIMAKVINDERETLCEFEVSGTLSQCYRYIVIQYTEYLKDLNDSIFLKQQDTICVDDLL